MLAQDRIGTVFTSPYNSPQAQHVRFRDDVARHDAKVRETGRQITPAIIAAVVVSFIGALLCLGSTLVGVVTIFLSLIYPAVNIFKWHEARSDLSHMRNIFTCPYCSERIPTYTPWVCGHCKTLNSARAWFHACEKCNLPPHSLSCPKCSNHSVFDPSNSRGGNNYSLSPTEVACLKGFKVKILEPEPEPTIETSLPLADRGLHTYLTGQSGAGKSELLKQLIFSLMDQPVATMVIDPGSDMATEIAKWPNPRLIYVEHNLRLGESPTINPFQIHGIEAENTKPEAIRVKRVIAQQLLDAFQQVVSGGEARAELSHNMQTILNACILTLLDKPRATIRDLQMFMDDTRNSELVKLGRTRYHYDAVQSFFEHSFVNKTHLRMTKDAIHTKLQDLLNTGTFADLTCGNGGESTIDLERAWNDKRMVVFNLGTIGRKEASAFSRLICAMMQATAERRALVTKGERVPCHFFIDECQNVVSNSIKEILENARRFKLILTLSQQSIGGDMSAAVKTAVLENTNLQIAGRTSSHFHKTIAGLFGTTPDQVATLEQGEFYARAGSKPPIRFKTPTNLLGDRGAVSEREWQDVRESQLRQFYRPTAPTDAQSKPPQQPDTIDAALAAVHERWGISKLVTKPKEDDTAPGKW